MSSSQTSVANIKRTAAVAVALGAAAGLALAAVVLPGWARGMAAAGAVAIDNFTFTPQTLRVQAGTVVTWTNKDDIPHGIASTDNAFARSQALDTDDAYSFTFTTPGTYRYFCYIHPHMTGTIVVEGPTGSNAGR
jgi:plastocyanin